MIGALLFLAFGYVVILHGNALKMAGIFGIVSFALSIFFWGFEILDAVIGVVIISAYAALVYSLVAQFSQQIILPLLILITGAFILFFWI